MEMPQRYRRERDHADQMGSEAPEYEPVYRDGTAKNECWASGDYVCVGAGERTACRIVTIQHSKATESTKK